MSDRNLKLEEFLLGSLSEEERQDFEDRALVDEDFFRQLEISEDDLVDAQARGELSTEQEHLFEQSLGSSKRIKERMILSKLLAAEADQASELAPVTSIWRRTSTKVLAAAALLLIAMGLPISKILDPVVEDEVDRPTESSLNKQSESPEVPSLQLKRVLTPLNTRSVEATGEVLELKPGTRLELYLELRNRTPAERFEVIARDTTGLLWHRKNLGSQTFDWGDAVHLEIEQSDLRSGVIDFLLHRAEGKEPPAFYQLHVRLVPSR